MFRWIPYAMVRIAAFFSAGIVLAIYLPNSISLTLAETILIALIVLYGLAYWLVPRRKRSLVAGVLGLLAIFFAGYVHLLLFVDWNQPNHLSTFKGEIKWYKAKILKLPEEKANSYKYPIRILEVGNGESWTPTDTRALLYIRRSEGQPQYFYGDKILVQGSPQLLKPPQNPHEFNFKRFLSFKNIYHQQFVKEGQVKLISSIQSKNLWYYSFVVREWGTKQLKAQLPNQQEQAIALALTLGVTDGIDNELQSAYASSGAMHVLAVSGLHVGILYGIVMLLFRPFTNLSWSRWVIAIISLLVLWSFAFITGLSPSVLRAVTMFSFIAIAKPFGRRTSIYNTLASSAFILLLFDPYLVMSVGFQLSYLAVLGIVTIHRPLYLLWEPRSRILDWVWNISCVSIAAQLATFSLGVLYFHQFPVYFLFSNLFVIPGAIFVLVTSIVVLATSVFPPIASLFGALLQGLIQLLNFAVFSIEKFPFSLINDISITTFQCWLLILAIGFLFLLFSEKKFSMMITSLGCVIAFSLIQWYHYSSDVRKDRLVVYNISGHRGIEWISNGKSQFMGDASLVADAERMRFHIRPNRLFCGVKEVETELVNERSPKVITRNGKKIGVITTPISFWPDHLRLDYLVVGNNAFKSLAQARNTINFNKLILDSSNSSYLASRIQSEGDDVVHSVQHEGAFIEIF
ncbi:MAG: ComEC/Rec2 family competence protein [Cyclobacteriaceae bacterium]